MALVVFFNDSRSTPLRINNEVYSGLRELISFKYSLALKLGSTHFNALVSGLSLIPNKSNEVAQFLGSILNPSLATVISFTS
ncbi:hypothetical protein [uncultured virus]|uniref:Uncharacterized protein n=1 Tax=uncultured virus TaxID=340016 RepID=A0A218MKS7_9VIRU|nr:hypothetical protein [uncultured virus]